MIKLILRLIVFITILLTLGFAGCASDSNSNSGNKSSNGGVSDQAAKYGVARFGEASWY